MGSACMSFGSRVCQVARTFNFTLFPKSRVAKRAVLVVDQSLKVVNAQNFIAVFFVSNGRVETLSLLAMLGEKLLNYLVVKKFFLSGS